MKLRTVTVLMLVATLLAACGSQSEQDPPPAATDSTPTVDSPSPMPTPEPEPIVLIIDGSGTMVITDVDPTRMDAAKTAAAALVDSLPDGRELAVVTYGTNTGNEDADKPAGCVDITTLSPVTVLDATTRTQATDLINGIQPSGYTPIAPPCSRPLIFCPMVAVPFCSSRTAKTPARHQTRVSRRKTLPRRTPS